MSSRLLLAVLFVLGCGASPVRPTDGAMIAVDFADTPIHDALFRIAQLAHVNIDGADPAVAGTVTLHMHAPWKAVLGRVAAGHGLVVSYQPFHGSTLVRVTGTAPAGPLPTTGAPMTARFEGTPIRDVARQIAAVAKQDIAVDADVDVAVTQIVRDMPWDLVLDHIARKYDLSITHDGATIHISKATAQ